MNFTGTCMYRATYLESLLDVPRTMCVYVFSNSVGEYPCSFGRALLAVSKYNCLPSITLRQKSNFCINFVAFTKSKSPCQTSDPQLPYQLTIFPYIDTLDPNRSCLHQEHVVSVATLGSQSCQQQGHTRVKATFACRSGCSPQATLTHRMPLLAEPRSGLWRYRMKEVDT